MALRDVEDKVTSLERQLGEMQSAIRNMSQQQNNVLEMLIKTNEQVQEVKVSVANVKSMIPPKAPRPVR